MPYSERRVIQDKVHGLIPLDSKLWKVVDSPHFQRLRDLKQLGNAHMVYPCATHTRFEHSIGVCHLSGELMEKFKREQPELEITKHDIFLVKLAGLCHDLGHGPCSHLFDSVFLPSVGETWNHEEGSKMMLEDLIDENYIDLDTNDTKIVKDMIDGIPQKRKFLYQIVANKQNSLDVDKFDYLRRDTMSVGFESVYATRRIMPYSRVVNDEICYSEKLAADIFEIFRSRYSLTRTLYSHKTSKAIDYMIVDALKLSDSVLKISQSIKNPKSFMNVSDVIISTISSSTDSRLQPAKNILQRIKNRDLYKMADEVVVDYSNRNQIKSMLTPEEVAMNSSILKKEDIHVDVSSYDYGNKQENPLNNVLFYSKSNINETFQIDSNAVSHLLPSKFCETVVRVFATDSKKQADVAIAFKSCLESVNRKLHVNISPSRYKRKYTD